jgi:hypothetical protein
MALTFAALIFSHIYLYLYDTVKAALERSQFSRFPNEEFLVSSGNHAVLPNPQFVWKPRWKTKIYPLVN